MLTHVDLFSGIGGFAIAAQWAGFKTVAFCEIDPYCQAILFQRFGTFADAAGEGLEKRGRKISARAGADERPIIGGTNRVPILFPDVRKIDGRRLRGATVISGGFPCQPFSTAGRRQGAADPRHLFPQMLRIISEARPAWVIGENVAGIIGMELEGVCAALEDEGYEVQPLPIPAAGLGAPHHRLRVFIIAHDGRAAGYDRDAAVVGLEGKQRRPAGAKPPHGYSDSLKAWEEPWPSVAARLCRVDDGLSPGVDEAGKVSCRRSPAAAGRTHRLRALGNAIVPAVAYEIFKGIAEVEKKRFQSSRRTRPIISTGGQQ